MAYSLDTSSFISALDRFQNRRGVPASYHSDNGTNFFGAQRELATCLENLNQHAIKEHLSRQPTKWYFNPPAAPHFGGVWERMVRAAKTALNAVLGNQRLTDEILLTALTLVENILNSRNLTPMSEDPTDPECLTPNHLLLGRACPNLPPDVFTESECTSCGFDLIIRCRPLCEGKSPYFQGFGQTFGCRDGFISCRERN
jgi:hypothetical protein